MILVVDLSNLIWSTFHSSISAERIKAEEVPKGYINHIYTFQQKLERIMHEQDITPGERIDYVFALDEKPRKKYAIFADYKKGRKRIDFNPRPAIMSLLSSWQSQTISSPDQEADDVIASFVGEHIDEKVVVASTDKDLWQLCENPTTKVFNFHKDALRYVTSEDLLKSFKLNDFTHIKLHKALWGDSGDGVPNVMPYMKKQLLPLVMQTDGTLEDFDMVIKEYWTGLTERCRDLYTRNKKRIDINYQLVKLNFDCDIKTEQLSLTSPSN